MFGVSSTTTNNVYLNKKNNKNHAGTRSSFCRGGFKILDTQTVQSLYVFTLKVFVVRNPDNFHTNSSIRSMDTRHESTTFTISEVFFNTKGCYLFLCKNIKQITTKHIETSYRYSYSKCAFRKFLLRTLSTQQMNF